MPFQGSSEEKHNNLNSQMKKVHHSFSSILFFPMMLCNTPFILKQQNSGVEHHDGSGPRPRRRWSRRIGSMDLKVKSMLDLRQLESFAMPLFPSRTPDVRKKPPPRKNQELGSTISLQTIAAWVRDHLAIMIYLYLKMKKSFFQH